MVYGPNTGLLFAVSGEVGAVSQQSRWSPSTSSTKRNKPWLRFF